MDVFFQPWFWIMILVLGVFGGLMQAGMDSDARKQNSHALTTIPNFSAALHYGGGLNKRGVAIDPASNQFAITRPNAPPAVYTFDQLVAVEIEKNGSSLQKTNRGSQVAGAAAGALLLGPVGLLLGGLTGSSRTEEKIKRLSLKIYTNDFVEPVTDIVFFEDSSGAKPDSILVKASVPALEQWYGRFQTILHMRESAAAAVS